MGPRPGQSDNILAMDYYEAYGKADRDKMRGIYKSRGYSHAVTGPFVDPGGYHGNWPAQPNNPTQASWDAYLDLMQEWWDDGIIPIHFLHPDNWDFNQTVSVFEPFLLQPRSQRLLRVMVPTGWEPAKYEWSSTTWAMYCSWMRRIMPNALVLIHTVSDVDAPAGVDANGDDNQNPNGNAGAWARVTPHIHGWLIQNGPYATRPSADPDLAGRFANQFLPSAPPRDGYWARFNQGFAGWPRNSAWGTDIGILLFNAECTSYIAFNDNLPEGDSADWGDLAVDSQANGYLDGGRKAVKGIGA